MIKNRFSELLAIHERKTRRKWTYEDIARATGLSTSTLSAYAQNRVRRFDAGTVEALVGFFGCDVGDLLIIEENGRVGQLVGAGAP